MRQHDGAMTGVMALQNFRRVPREGIFSVALNRENEQHRFVLTRQWARDRILQQRIAASVPIHSLLPSDSEALRLRNVHNAHRPRPRRPASPDGPTVACVRNRRGPGGAIGRLAHQKLPGLGRRP